jgi:hypothetical protein
MNAQRCLSRFAGVLRMVRGRAAGLLAVVGLMIAPALSQAAGNRLTRSPSANRTLSQATLLACETAPGSPACVSSVMGAINAARAAEGIRPMRLPADFGALSVSGQLLVVANLERVDRGLIPAIGLARSLNQSALSAAKSNQDPVPHPFYGNAFGSNWAGGIGSALAADFLWMYDDGPGSGNIDCRTAQDAGCWGHRTNILARYEAPLAMGTAAVGNSMTELFVGGDLQAKPGHADAVFTRLAHKVRPTAALARAAFSLN